MNPWVLVVDSGSGQNRAALAAVRALAMAGYRSAVTVSSEPALAAVSKYCHRVVPTPNVGSPGFAAAVQAETASHAYLGVMPASDAALIALSTPEAAFVNKEKLAKRAADVGLNVPPHRVFDSVHSLANAAKDLDYPLVVKSALKVSILHRPARRMESPADLEQLRGTATPLIVQPYILGEMHSLAGVMWRRRLVVAVHQRHLRIWPPICGDACAALTIAPDEESVRKVERLLTTYEGVFQAEFVGKYLLDINPRVYGSLPLAVTAGANLVGVYWDRVRGLPFEQTTPRLGVKYYWWEGDMRNMLSRWRAGDIRTSEAVRALRTTTGIRAVREFLDDPRPAMARVRYAAASRGAASPSAPRRE